MPDPILQVALLKPEEAEQYMRIRHEVFRTTVNKILYSRGEASQRTLDRVTADIKDGIINKGVMYLKCVDTSTGEIIAGARWRYVRAKDPKAKERTWEEVEEGLQQPLPIFDESEPAMVEALHQLFAEHKRKFLGTKPYFVLDTLVTLPQHERRGAGGILVKWGCAKADEENVVAYLEASPVGAPVYARYGFQKQTEIEFDTIKYGGDEIFTFTPMLRPARGSAP